MSAHGMRRRSRHGPDGSESELFASILRHVDQAVAWSVRDLRTHEDREDATQAGRIAALEAVRSHDPSKGASLRTWACRAAVAAAARGSRDISGVRCPEGVMRALPFVRQAEEIAGDSGCSYPELQRASLRLAEAHYRAWYTEQRPQDSSESIDRRTRRRLVHAGIKAAVDNLPLWHPWLKGSASLPDEALAAQRTDDHSSSESAVAELLRHDLPDSVKKVYDAMINMGPRATVGAISGATGMTPAAVRRVRKDIRTQALKLLNDHIGSR